MALSKPIIDDHIVECCKRVWVRNITLGSDVTLFINSWDTTRSEVDQSIVVFELPESSFPEGLRSGDTLRVRLSLAGEPPVQSDRVTVRPATTPRPNLPEPIYECTYRVVCKGLEPGNTVSLEPARGGPVISSHPHADIEGEARIVINEDTVIPQSTGPIIARASNCQGGAATSEPKGVLTTPPLTRPKIEEPVYGCETSIDISNLTQGSRVDIVVTSSDGTTWNRYFYAPFSTSKPTNLGQELNAGDTITVQQSMRKPRQNIICDRTGRVSEPVTVVNATADDIKPKIQTPVYAGTDKIWVSQQRGGGVLRLSIIEPEPNQEFGPIQSNAEYKGPRDFGLAFSLPTPLIAEQKVQVSQTLCGVTGVDEVEVRPVPSELPTPFIRQPLYECGRWVVVEIPDGSGLSSLKGVEVLVYAFTSEDGATSADLTTPINSRLEAPTPLSQTAVSVKVMRSSGLDGGEWIVAELVFGGSHSERSDPVQVREEDVPPPPKVLPLYEGERCVRIENIRQGATVEVFDESISSEEPIARDIATDVRNEKIMICLGRSVSGNSQLTARQTLCGRSNKSRPGQIISWKGAMEDAHEDCRGEANSRYDAGIEENLTWNTEMAEQAQDWAEHLRDLGRIEHSSHESRPGVGENLYSFPLGMISDDPEEMGAESVRIVLQNVCTEEDFAAGLCGWGWCAEKVYFTHPDRPYPACCEEPIDPAPRNEKHCGHYTQVVWHNTTQIGCGVAVDLEDNSYWVCRYRPGGNISNRQPFGERK
jgi:hypothetical protein